MEVNEHSKDFMIYGHNIMGFDQIKLREITKAYHPATNETHPITKASMGLGKVISRGRFTLDTYRYMFNYRNIFSTNKLESLVDLDKSINYEDVVNKYKKYLLPDPGLNIASEKYSQIFPHNDFALANINPIRIIVSLKDEDGLTALTKNDPIIKTSDPVKKIEVVGNPKSESIFYIDIYNDKPLKTKATISIENIEQEVDLTFAPFCKNEIKYCVTHPRQTLWFLQNKIQEKIQILEKKL